MDANEFRYRAFISYSHQDAGWAIWLHKRLENYRIPRRLRGRSPIPGAPADRLAPVFRDRDELPSSAELGGVINEALRRSQFQIVVCSPRAATSRWVNEELRYFKSLGREGRVLSLIVDGQPNAGPHDPRECFPEALRFRVDANGVVGSEPSEPIAADARAGRDGRERAFLKLVAGLLDVGFDELRQRERQKRFWTRVQVAAAAGLALGLLAAAWHWEEGRRARALAEQALEVRLDRLVEAGRGELHRQREARAAVYFEEALKLGRDTPAVRFMLHQALLPVIAQQRALTAHAREISHVAYSPDGRYVLSGSFDRSLKIWDTHSGAPVQTLQGHAANLFDAQFCADASHVLSVGPAQDDFFPDSLDLILWDVAGGRAQLKLGGYDTYALFQPFDRDCRRVVMLEADGHASVRDLADSHVVFALKPGAAITVAGFGGDGNSLVTGSADGRVIVWNAADGTQRFVLETAGAPVTQAAASADGQRLVLMRRDGSFHIWDMTTRQLRVAAAIRNGVRTIRLSADGSRLLVVATGEISVWDTRSGTLLYSRPTTLNYSRFYSTLSADGESLLTIEDGTAMLIDLASGRPLFGLDGHAGGARAAAFAPVGKAAVTGGSDGRLVFWQLGFKPLATLRHGRAPERSIDDGVWWPGFDARGERILTTAGDGRAKIWDAGGHLQTELIGHTQLVKLGVFSPDGSQVLTASNDRTARLWDAASGRLLRTFDGHEAAVRLVEFSPDGRRILTSGYHGMPVQEWDASTGERLLQIAEGPGEMLAGRFSPDGSRILSYSINGHVKLSDARSGQVLLRLEGHRSMSDFASRVTTAVFSADGATILTSSLDRTLRLWDAASGAERAHEDAGGPVVMAGFDRDARRVAAATMENVAAIWTPSNGQLLTLGDHSGAVNGAAFSGDGERVFTTGEDGKADVWDARNGHLLATVGVQGGGITYRSFFSPDDTRVLTPGNDDTARLWDTALETRSAEEIDRLLHCSAPWRLSGEVMEAMTPPDCATAMR